jgi:hypothetical protein
MQGRLIKFIQDNCANYDHHFGGCLFNDKCKVLQSQRCSYFERAVLATGNMTIAAAYSKKVNAEVKIKTQGIRYCACGRILQPREKICRKCTEKHRQARYRENRDRKKRVLA